MMMRSRPFLLFLSAHLIGWSFPAAADLDKLNVGLYGGNVADIAAFENASSDTEVLIAVDSSQRGIFQWDSVNEEWSSVSYPN